jgi:uncharacterized membrane protein YhaH (DUF805 family)
MSFFRRWLSFAGRINRVQYLVAGLVLVPLKYAVDSNIAARFGQSWHITNYFLPPANMTVFGLGAQPRLYLILWAVAVPFFWVGVSLTVQRLRDAGQRLGWLVLFFVPVANFLFFLFLCLVPSEAETDARVEALPARAGEKTPFSPLWGVVVAAVLGLALEVFGANFLAQYAWGLFLGVPFVTGFLTAWVMNTRRMYSRSQTIGMCCVTPMVIGFALIGFRLEGLMCLVMAVPLALPFSIAGGLTAYSWMRSSQVPLNFPRVTSCVAILPLLMLGERAAKLEPPARPVVTTIVVNAPVSMVWRNVIAFPPLAPPKELLFQTGIAYPIGAVIEGSGVGAVRRCRFSTGDFVEPVTVWDEDHLLAFNVAAQPPAMHELGFGPIATPHIERNYMRSQHGQFRLVALDANHTLLEGTTWYQDYFWPQVYWRAWSDAIVHRIHMRVLEHVKEQAEMQAGLVRP